MNLFIFWIFILTIFSIFKCKRRINAKEKSDHFLISAWLGKSQIDFPRSFLLEQRLSFLNHSKKWSQYSKIIFAAMAKGTFFSMGYIDLWLLTATRTALFLQGKNFVLSSIFDREEVLWNSNRQILPLLAGLYGGNGFLFDWHCVIIIIRTTYSKSLMLCKKVYK